MWVGREKPCPFCREKKGKRPGSLSSHLAKPTAPPETGRFGNPARAPGSFWRPEPRPPRNPQGGGAPWGDPPRGGSHAPPPPPALGLGGPLPPGGGRSPSSPPPAAARAAVIGWGGGLGCGKTPGVLLGKPLLFPPFDFLGCAIFWVIRIFF